MTTITKERVEELRVFLLTLSAEGWSPGRRNWGRDISDLLAILDDYAERLESTACPKCLSADFSTKYSCMPEDHLEHYCRNCTNRWDTDTADKRPIPSPGPTDAESWVRKETEIALDALNQLESPGPTDADERALSLKLTQWSARLMKDMNWTPEDDEAYHKLRSRLAAPRVQVTREWLDATASDVYTAVLHNGEARRCLINRLRSLGVSVESGEEER